MRTANRQMAFLYVNQNIQWKYTGQSAQEAKTSDKGKRLHLSSTAVSLS